MERCRSVPALFLFLAGILSSLNACKHRSERDLNLPDSFSLRTDIYTPVTFIQHEASGPQLTYLAQNIYSPSVDVLRDEIERKYQVKLKSRGEAHITVITPGEYENILQKRLSMAKISQLARESQIQQIPFQTVCLGRGTKEIDHHQATTYFVVVVSPGLVELRAKIRDAFVRAGGRASDFSAEFFRPHVTVGFTDRDLHLEDGINKDRSACIGNLDPVAP